MIAIFIWFISLAVGSASNFRVMQKSNPRNDFVLRQPSAGHELHTLVFAVKQNNLPELDEMLIERSTPGNALYQQWLSFDQITALTQNNEGTSQVLDWLTSHNITVTWKSIRHDYIKAEANISTWETLLDTKFHLYEDLSRTFSDTTTTKQTTQKSRMMHRAKQYSLPEHLTPHLSAVFNTVQVPPVFAPRYQLREDDNTAFRTNLRVNKVNPTNNKPYKQNNHKKQATATNGKVTVSFLNELYEISSNTGQATQSQSVFETSEQSFSPNDLSLFQSTYNLPPQAALHPFGFNTTLCSGGTDCTEGNLDVQYMMGVAQLTATIYWYVSDETNSDPFVAWVADVANTVNPPLVNSMSWGSIEQANSEDVLIAFNTEALKLSAMGVTITVSTGDNGAASGAAYCNVRANYGFWKGPSTWSGKGYFPSFPATSPYVTAVGATMGPESGTEEIACQSQLGGVITTGGGFSTYNPTPSWQQTAVSAYFSNLTTTQTPTSGYNSKWRGIPDVSVIGVAYQVYLQSQLVSLYGTSAAAPVFAALVSLANAARAAQNKTSLGFLNPTLYARGMDTTTKHLFNDVTSGHNKCMVYGTTCCTSGFYATDGWDPVIGLGTITLPNLLAVFINGSVSLAPTVLPTTVPTRKPFVTPTLRPSRSPTTTPTTPTTTPSTTPTTTPTTISTTTPTIHPTIVHSMYPTELPSQEPTADPTAAPSTPSVVPTLVPTVVQTVLPTSVPTVLQTSAPTTDGPTTTSTTITPAVLPTHTPTTTPTLPPITLPPTLLPTCNPSMQTSTLPPTLPPTPLPTLAPTYTPTVELSGPSPTPTLEPTAPTVVPTVELSIIQTTMPTNAPTTILTTTPTTTPSITPSITPNITPTTATTVIPSIQPTVVPTVVLPKPTIMFKPTNAPTSATLHPTTVTSTQPTILPTTHITISPTTKPTAIPTTHIITPTPAPTLQTSPVLTFTCTVTLTGLEKPQLSSAAQGVLIQTMASVHHISVDAVIYIDAPVVEESTTPRTQTLMSNKQHTLATFTLDTHTQVSVVLADTVYATTTELYTALSNTLQSSVNSGNFTTILHTIATTHNVTDLSTATATSATTSNPVTTSPTTNSNSNNSDLSTGEISAIVVAGFALITVILCAGVCVCGRSSGSVCDNSGTVEATAVPAVEVRSPETTVAEATVVCINNTYSQDDIPYPDGQVVCIDEHNPQVAVVV